MGGVEHPPVPDDVARKAAEFYKRERFAIIWTQSRNGTKVSKRFAAKDWQQTGPLEDVEDFVKRLTFANPGINLRGSRLIGVEIDGTDELERFEALGIPRAGMVAQSSTPERLHFFYDWPREIADNEPVSFRFEAGSVTAVTNNGYVCWPGTHPSGERKWKTFDRGVVDEAHYAKLGAAAGTAKREQRQRVRDGEKVPLHRRHTFLIAETGRLRALGLTERDALAALIGIDQLHCEPLLWAEDPDEMRNMVVDIYTKDPLPAIVRETPSVSFDGNLAAVLEDLRRYYRKYVVVPELQADAVALWCAHTFVYADFRVTPYLNFWSPEPGSAKTLSLEILEPVVRAGFIVDDLTGAVLFRFVDQTRPTLFFDEVDGVFSKKNDAGAEDIRKVLNSGHRQGKRVLRMGGKNNTEVQYFDPFCPKALAGLHDLPATLAHRSIPIALKPPLPSERYEDDYDIEDVEREAADIRARLQAWADTQPPLKDKQRKPKRLLELDARRNEIWRPLLRIADLAGGQWPQAARDAATALSAGETAADEKSAGVRLLGDIQGVFDEQETANVSTATLLGALYELEEAPWGEWFGKPLSARGLSKLLKGYKIRPLKVRLDDVTTAQGYKRSQFEHEWARYGLSGAPTPSLSGTSSTTRMVEPETALFKAEQTSECSGYEDSANPHGYADVPDVPATGGIGARNAEDDEFEGLF